MKRVRGAGGLVCIFILAGHLFAQTNGFQLVTHGFVSQGYIRSGYNNYLLMSRDGSFEFNEAALSISAQATDRLRIGIQLFGRDFGFEGNNEVGIDWAYGDYRWRDGLGVRIGKIKLPLGLYNQGRDVDLLRNSILLPQGVYDEAMRDFTLAHQGAGLYGNLELGSAGSADYEAFYGTITIPDPNAGYWRWVFSDLSASTVRMLPPGSTADIRNPAVVGKYVWGGALRWRTPLAGLLVGVHHAVGKMAMAADVQAIIPVISNLSILHPLLDGVALQNSLAMHMDIDVRIEGYSTFSAEYTRGGLTCAAEYHRHTYKTTLLSPPGMQTWKSEGYYGQASWRFFPWFEAGVYYSEFFPDRLDKKGTGRAAVGEPDFRAWQKDAAATLRFDMNKNWCLKFEAHKLDGAAQVFLFDNPDGIKRHWSLLAVKTSYGF